MSNGNRQQELSAVTGWDRLLTRREAAEFLGLAASTLAAWRSDGRKDSPPLFKFGRAVRYSRKDLIAWQERQRA